MRIHTVKSGDTLSNIGRQYGVSVDWLVENNQIADPNRLVVGQAIVAPDNPVQYTIQKGDRLYSIAKRFGTTVDAIVALNRHIADPNRIFPGQRILISAETVPSRSIISTGYCYPFISEDTLLQALPYLTYVNSFSYNVNRDGSLMPIKDTNVINTALAGGVAPVMVITNFNEKGAFSSERASAILNNPACRKRLIREIETMMRRKGFRGLDIDFENVYAKDRDAYNKFLKQVVDSLHPHGYIVSSAVPAKTSDSQTGILVEGVDYAAHGRILDYVFLMTYDWGYQYGPPMAVAPLDKVEQVVKYAVSVMPSKKIVLGIPNYAYDWTLPYKKGDRAKLTMLAEAVNLAARHWSQINFDQTAKTPYFNYEDDKGKQHVVWFDDARSYQAKFELVDKYNLAGVGFWNINTQFRPGFLILSSMYTIDKVVLPD
ncbi:LysM peptidoglycan-binding domain-containing protein [Eubacteriales bacterium OttesenSCG-928-K08]|nr:LysM peptidoglycan-binding domain-containing protein [Eubacteriales bacterium OttesenSCG-928-K08]